MQPTLQDKLEKRRRHEGFIHERIEKDVLFRRMPLKKQKNYKKRIRVLDAEYNFLQYLYIIKEWTHRNHKITPRELDVLLYLYPMGTFTKAQFITFLSELGISGYNMYNSLMEKGWMILWAKSEDREYFSLSHKGNELVKKIHRMCMLEEEIPMSARRNVIVRSRKKSDQKLVDIFNLFNNKVKNNPNLNK